MATLGACVRGGWPETAGGSRDAQTLLRAASFAGVAEPRGPGRSP
jgi:hypothetical protein